MRRWSVRFGYDGDPIHADDHGATVIPPREADDTIAPYARRKAICVLECYENQLEEVQGAKLPAGSCLEAMPRNTTRLARRGRHVAGPVDPLQTIERLSP